MFSVCRMAIQVDGGILLVEIDNVELDDEEDAVVFAVLADVAHRLTVPVLFEVEFEATGEGDVEGEVVKVDVSVDKVGRDDLVWLDGDFLSMCAVTHEALSVFVRL